MKTLAQVAFEAYEVDLLNTWRPDWESEVTEKTKALWEAAAQAVRAAVIEEVAKYLESSHRRFDGAVICDIRALKDKK